MESDRIRSNCRGIVLCADDFGANAACSRAIIELARKRAISAASCLVDAPYTAANVALLQSSAPHLSIGLHLDLTEFTASPTRATLQRWLMRGFLLRNIEAAAMLVEIRRQLARFEKLTGAAPAFVDGHCHVHQIPGVREPLLLELKRRYGHSVAVRSTRSSLTGNLKMRFLQELGGRAMHSLIAQSSLFCNTDFGGAYDFAMKPSFGARMEQWLRGIADGGLIMCHPEMPHHAGVPRSAREAEYCFLASSSWAELQSRNDVRLRGFISLHSAL